MNAKIKNKPPSRERVNKNKQERPLSKQEDSSSSMSSRN